ncbi:BON domain-containing protein [Rhodocyclus tenuis]|uniref:BON domain-containing protein n=1 Tax=Rhodocyclus tenuis TaxID=1066 RepID=A0A6L5K005_RHOTE|nr:BON domain-containing protein [Rhodocyclus gracilis]MQY52234.1 BON domain-containing protein [Rhodocyclus gracilis]MRD72336.1 BON domain-containing protein [Rhodocyclus gracilis]
MKTDSQLQHDVSDELTWEPAVHAAQIGVEAKDGVITLAGEVGSYAEKWAAERAAQRVAGVMALAVDIDVKLNPLSKRSDADIARSAENVLEWMTALRDGCVKVIVEDGWITLSGEVDWHYQRQAAVDAVCHLLGVTGVSDQIAIKPDAPFNAIKSDIEAAIKRRVDGHANTVHVAVHDAEVTLSGTIRDWSERDLVTHAAWCTPGVRRVIDRLTVAS